MCFTLKCIKQQVMWECNKKYKNIHTETTLYFSLTVFGIVTYYIAPSSDLSFKNLFRQHTADKLCPVSELQGFGKMEWEHLNSHSYLQPFLSKFDIFLLDWEALITVSSYMYILQQNITFFSTVNQVDGTICQGNPGLTCKLVHTMSRHPFFFFLYCVGCSLSQRKVSNGVVIHVIHTQYFVFPVFFSLSHTKVQIL